VKNVAVLGCGSIGSRHASNLLSLGYRVIAYDPSAASRARFEHQVGSACASDIRHVWDCKPEVCVIASTPEYHVDLAFQAVNFDCHLLIEKPVSHTLENVPELVNLVHKKGLTGMVSCNMRFHPGIKAVKALVEDRHVGAIIAARLHTGSFLPDWRPWTDYRLGYSVDGARGGGALLECIHEIDIALWLFGPARLGGAATLPTYLDTRNAEGLAELLLRHDSGVLSSIHLNFVQRDYRRFYELIGESGTIYWDFHSSDVVVRRGTSQVEDVRASENWNTNQMYVDELTYFFKCIDRQEEPFSTIEDGFSALKIALEARNYSSTNAG